MEAVWPGSGSGELPGKRLPGFKKAAFGLERGQKHRLTVVNKEIIMRKHGKRILATGLCTVLALSGCSGSSGKVSGPAGSSGDKGAKPDPEKYRSQITLAVRRIKALEIANHLIEAELERGSMEEKH